MEIKYQISSFNPLTAGHFSADAKIDSFDKICSRELACRTFAPTSGNIASNDILFGSITDYALLFMKI